MKRKLTLAGLGLLALFIFYVALAGPAERWSMSGDTLGERTTRSDVVDMIYGPLAQVSLLQPNCADLLAHYIHFWTSDLIENYTVDNE